MLSNHLFQMACSPDRRMNLAFYDSISSTVARLTFPDSALTQRQIGVQSHPGITNHAQIPMNRSSSGEVQWFTLPAWPQFLLPGALRCDVTMRDTPEPVSSTASEPEQRAESGSLLLQGAISLLYGHSAIVFLRGS